MASLSSINIKFKADLEGFSGEMGKVQKQLNDVGKSLQTVGVDLTTGLTLPLLGFAAVAVNAAGKLETLKTSLDTAFNGDKLASSGAFDEIKKFTEGTTIQVEDAIDAFVKLKNMGLDPSIAALTSYGNTAAATGKDLNQMIEAVADASFGEFERLKEFGIRAKDEGAKFGFTFQGVTTSVEKNSGAIQKYLQNIGNVEFAGALDRQANTFEGKLSSIKSNLADLGASLGAIIIDYITPFVNYLKELSEKFQSLSPTTQKWIIILGGVAAAIGPILALAGTILPLLITGFGLLLSPITLVVAALVAIGYVIYKNWAPIKKTLIDIANYFVDLYNESMAFKVAVNGVIAVFKTLFEVGKFVFEGLKSVASGFIDNFTNGFKTVGKIIKAVLTGDIGAIPEIVKEASEQSQKNFGDLTSSLGKDWDGLMAGIERVSNETLEGITSKKKLKYFEENVDATGITDAVANATTTGLNNGGNELVVDLSKAKTKGELKMTEDDLMDLADLQSKTDSLAKIPETLNNASQNLANAMDETVQSNFLGVVSENYDQFNQDTEDDLLIPFQEKMERMKEMGQAVGEAVSGAFDTLSGKIVDSLGLANDGFDGFIKGLIGTVTKLISLMLASAISQSIAGATASGTATGPAAIFTTPAFIATAVGGILSAFAAIPKFATGGIVDGTSFYGDKILARVNSGELILNQKQQRNLYGQLQPNQSDTVVLNSSYRISGSDLLVITERAQKSKNRVG